MATIQQAIFSGNDLTENDQLCVLFCYCVSIIPIAANTPNILITTISDTNVTDRTLNSFLGFLYQPHMRVVKRVKYKKISGRPIR